MIVLSPDYFKLGDIVSVRWDDVWIAGRVIACVESVRHERQKRLFDRYGESAIPGLAIAPPDESCRCAIRVAFNNPYYDVTLWRVRFFHKGMPLYDDFEAEDVRLDVHDPNWDAFAIEPYAGAHVHRERGMYPDGSYYKAGDPIWVWENKRWHPALVVSVGRWVSVRYLNGFRDRKGNSSKSYRTWQIWPIVSEPSAAFRGKVERFL
ncbi:hypothetical protein AB0G02_06425 [Actinosynnema sp. NPDC023658]|uniref:hypothetical protein n=1 Tax=Actinosynnema sp. NPDC023658 TaxID=3155465 RepID=UPI003404A1BB